jgi:hypothetical protein
MKIFSFIIVSIFVLILIAGCESSTERKPVTTQQPPPPVNQQNTSPTNNDFPVPRQENIDPKIAQQIIAVIKENLDANEKEDKARVLKTIHKDSPQRQSTINGMNFVFPQYDLHFQLDKIEVLRVDGDSAIVYFKQTTIPVGKSPGLAPSTSTGLHYLEKEGKNWKLFKTEFISTDYLKAKQ